MGEGCAGVMAGSLTLADVAMRDNLSFRNPNGLLTGLVVWIGRGGGGGDLSVRLARRRLSTI
jgi:hypothetical protein